MTRKRVQTKRVQRKRGGTNKAHPKVRSTKLPMPNVEFLAKEPSKGSFKTVWQLKNSPLVVINSNPSQVRDKDKDKDKPYLKQFNEYLFSRSLSTAYPDFFPAVYELYEPISTRELEMIDQMDRNRNHTPSEETPTFKYIWLKEACHPPDLKELQENFLEKAIQLLVDLMKKGLCYIDIKPMNIGKRGESYVIIDSGVEDIYLIPKEYQSDYLRGEILICGMCLYHYLKENRALLQNTYQKIKNVFHFILNKPMEELEVEALEAVLKEGIPSNDKNTVNKKDLINLRTYLYNKYNCTLQDKDPCPISKMANTGSDNPFQYKEGKSCSITARLLNYCSLPYIKQFFSEYDPVKIERAT